MLSTRWKNWKLRRERRKLEKESKRVQKEARQKKDDQIYEEWYSINNREFWRIDADIQQNDCRDLLDEAEKLYLPTPHPSDTDKWMSDEDLNVPAFWERYNVLTPEAMTELRGAIRNEKRERREVMESWLKIAGAFIAILTGLIGTVIGLVAVLKKNH